MANVKWIKLATDIFDNRKIRLIETLPDGDSLIVIWLKLLILAGEINDNGYVYFTKDIPFTDQLLSTQFNRPIATIQLALNTFEKFGMINIVDDLIMVSNWEKYQNIESMERIREQNRIRKQRQREREKLLITTDNVTSRDSHAGEKNKNKKRKEENRREQNRKELMVVIDEFTENEELKNTLLAFLKMRKLIKKPMTDKALTILLNKLSKLSKDPDTQIAILNQSIENSWQSVYELKTTRGANGIKVTGEQHDILDDIL